MAVILLHVSLGSRAWSCQLGLCNTYIYIKTVYLRQKRYKLYETLTDPGPGAGEEENEATEFDKTVLTLNAYFVTKINEPYERHVFRNIAQQEGETVDQFIAKLRKQAENCNFANADVDIRDQVIDKCRSSALRRKLLGKENLTLKKVQDLARAMEAVDLQSKKMGGSSNDIESLEVNKVFQKLSTQTPKSAKGRCYRCDREGHFSKDKCCPARQAVCGKCNKTGHFAVVCKSNNDSGATSRKNSRKPETRYTRYVEEDVREDTEDEDELGIFTTRSSKKVGRTSIYISVK